MQECGRNAVPRRVFALTLLRCCILALPLFLTGACTRVHAKTTPDTPQLSVPAAPPRLVEPADAETPPATPAPAQPEEPARRPPVRPRPAPPPATPAPTAAEKAADKPGDSKPADESKPPPTSTSLQTTPAGAEGELERTIRGLLTKATTDLNRIDYRNLNADARTQYDTAKRFVQQAEDALRGRNLVFARNLADKAAALAGELAGK